MSAPVFARTPAGDGFAIHDRHRAANGNIHWRLIWRDFASFVGLTDDDLVSHDPLWLHDKLSMAAIARGYDYSCVGALLNPYVRSDAIAYAAALGFHPLYLWPATAKKWPLSSQWNFRIIEGTPDETDIMRTALLSQGPGAA